MSLSLKKKKKATTHSTQGCSSVYLPLLETERLAQRWDFCMRNCFPARTCTFTCALLSTQAAAYQLQRNQTKSDAQTYIKHFDTAGLLHHLYKTKTKILSLSPKNIDFLSTKYFKLTSWEVRACRCLISPVQCNIIQTFWIYLRSEWALGVDTHAATWPIIKINSKYISTHFGSPSDRLVIIQTAWECDGTEVNCWAVLDRHFDPSAKMSACPLFAHTKNNNSKMKQNKKFPPNPKSWILSGVHCQECDISQSSLCGKNATVVNEQISATVLSKRIARADTETVFCWI